MSSVQVEGQEGCEELYSRAWIYDGSNCGTRTVISVGWAEEEVVEESQLMYRCLGPPPSHRTSRDTGE